jgi:FMN phosphatase YigB (HAD superfamily)
VSSYDAVLFDLDGTLCRRTQDTEWLYTKTFERAGVEPFGEPEALWEALDGPPDHDDWTGYLGAGFARLAAQHGRSSVDPVVLAEAFLSLSDDSAVELLPGADSALQAASQTGPLGVVTNGPHRSQKLKLDTLGVREQFDSVVYAADLGRKKPLAAPFDRALDALEASADRTLYVGNSLEYDVAGAHNAGLAAAWLRDTDEDPTPYAPEYVIDSLAELPEILQDQ